MGLQDSHISSFYFGFIVIFKITVLSSEQYAERHSLSKQKKIISSSLTTETPTFLALVVFV